ncbi:MULTISPECIES: DMT family transporter [Bacillus]|uniref:DMT family transporter n=1 Tax=Bacillus TaxID=1386 RepID=UPI0015838222|nr:multidrug efflux SMR transporter [Bacillus glycinifermentans]MBU8786706.1 multidrug efflux SMR transporter [Bacillus glycinifermentans]NUJ18299.1 multidrug efflux SMR transporter [Bacillus glycinifermentans]
MHWLYLCLAVLFETAGTVSMKLSNGFSKVVPSVLLLAFYGASLAFLTLTLKTMDVSVAYAVWSGVGIVLISLIGFLFLGESVSIVKAVSIILIITGVVALNITEHRSIN